MITKEKAQALRKLALRTMLMNQHQIVDVSVPDKAPKNPVEWVVTADCGSSAGGSYRKYPRGYRTRDPREAAILKQEGCPIAAAA